MTDTQTSSWQLLTAARTLWQECRGESPEGRQAVAHVLWNRVRSGRWGKTLASVCLWRMQFSGWLPSDPNFEASCALADDDPVLLEMIGIIRAAATEPDPTNGATHYYALSMKVPPAWAAGATLCGIFGHQRFFKDVC
jgi:spore germination cell wall hydrolase CwlJ-like protein